MIDKFSTAIKKLEGDVELVVRMIIGAQYNKDIEQERIQIKNCFIQLLNGAAIDADRLDYACRDVWASGYSTSTIDMERMVSGMHIAPKEENGISKYVVCYQANVLNEIESVIDIKEFQHKYVFHHHTVAYENYLLKKAAEKMAVQYAIVKAKNQQETEDDYAKRALESIISIDALSPEGISIRTIPNAKTSRSTTKISYIMDDDLVFMMKHSNNPYYKEWSHRQYSRFALWKNPDEFYMYFNIDRKVQLKNAHFKKTVMNALKAYGDVLVLEEEYKAREDIKNLNVCLGNEVISLNKLNSEFNKCGQDKTFYYVYVPTPKIISVPTEDGINQLRKEILLKLSSVIQELYKPNKQK